MAEDNELSAQVLEQLLIRKGHRVRLASNGREALALAEEGGFRLVPPGRPHAGAGRLPSRAGGSGARAERRGTFACHRLDGAFAERGPRALPGRRHGRLPDQAGPASRAVGGHRPRDEESIHPANLPAWSCSTCRCCWPPAGATPSCSGRCASRSRRESRSTWRSCATHCATKTPRAYAKRLTNSAACFRSFRRSPAIGRAAWRILRPVHRFTKPPPSWKNSKRWPPKLVQLADGLSLEALQSTPQLDDIR